MGETGSQEAIISVDDIALSNALSGSLAGTIKWMLMEMY